MPTPTDNAETLLGTEADDTLFGAGGDDIILGLGGDDTFLEAGTWIGFDESGQGAGSDTYDGGSGFDTLSFAGRNTFVEIYLSLGAAVTQAPDGGFSSSSDRFREVEHLIGTDLNDRLVADAAGFSADLGAASDRVEVSVLDGEFNGGSGSDTLDFRAIQGGIKLDFRSDSLRVTGGGPSADGFVFDEFESATGAYDFKNELVGNGQSNWLTGGRRDDVLLGFGGDDVLTGGFGDDTLNGQDGADTVYAGEGKDTVTGGSGRDMLQGGRGNDEIRGGVGADEIRGDGGKDVIHGDIGRDDIDGGGSGDRIYGGADNDTIDGGGGNDRVFGQGGDDRLNDIYGRNVLDGGAGDDVLRGGGTGSEFFGGEGNDRFVLLRDVTAFGGAGADTFVITGRKLDAVIRGQAGDDRLEILGKSTVQADLGKGDDTALIESIEDRDGVVIDMGEGNDRIEAFDGFETVMLGDGNDQITLAGVLRGSIETGRGRDVILFQDQGANASVRVSDFDVARDRIDLGNIGSADDVVLTQTSNGVQVALDGAARALLVLEDLTVGDMSDAIFL